MIGSESRKSLLPFAMNIAVHAHGELVGEGLESSSIRACMILVLILIESNPDN